MRKPKPTVILTLANRSGRFHYDGHYAMSATSRPHEYCRPEFEVALRMLRELLPGKSTAAIRQKVVFLVVPVHWVELTVGGAARVGG